MAVTAVNMEYSSVIESLCIPAAVVSSKGVVLEWNEEAYIFFGWQRSDIVGRLFPVLETERRELLTLIDDCATKRTKIRNQQTLSVATMAHLVRPIKLDMCPLPTTKETTVDVFLQFAELPTQIGAREILAIDGTVSNSSPTPPERIDQTDWLRVIAQNMPVLFIASSDTGVQIWNKKCEDTLGWTAAEICGNPRVKELLWDEDKAEEIIKFMQSPGQFSNYVVPYKCKDGGVKLVSWSSVHENMPPGITSWGVGVDITDSIHKEEDLRRKLQEAELAVQMKSQFLATMSHEIRTPMNGVIGMTGLLLDTNLTVEQRDYAETIRTSGRSLLDIINDILDFSKIEAGKMVLEHTAFNVHQIVEDVLDLVAEQASTKRVELVMIPGIGLPSAVVGDPGRLRQILTNLVGNAVKFTSGVSREDGSVGEVLVEVVKLGMVGRKCNVRFAVRDNGIGMSAELQSRLFEAFSQGDGSTTRKYGGTGLGLAITKQLVELMGGKLQVSSVEGRGSSFTLDLCLPVTSDEESVVDFSQASSWQLERLQGHHVLCVESHLATRRSILMRAMEWGMPMDEAAEGAAGLKMAQEGQYDVVLVSHDLPDMTGFEFAHELVNTCQVKPHVIMIRSLKDRELPDFLAENRVDGTLCKPIRGRQLLDVLCRLGLLGEEAAARSPTMGSTSLPPASADRFRVLLAEDNPVNQRVAIMVLQKLGHRVDAVSNGREAVEMLRTVPYDVVIMDCQMPELDGYEATKLIRKMDGFVSRIPIIALTASALQSDRDKCAAVGMDGYLSKPFDTHQLDTLLTHVVKGRSVLFPSSAALSALNSSSRSTSASLSNISSPPTPSGHTNPSSPRRSGGLSLSPSVLEMSPFVVSADISFSQSLHNSTSSSTQDILAIRIPSSAASTVRHMSPASTPSASTDEGSMKRMSLDALPPSSVLSAPPTSVYYPLDRSVLDEYRAMETVGEPSCVLGIIEIFEDDLPKQMSNLKSALEAQDFDVAARVFHKLRGGAGGVGAVTFAGLCLKGERLAKSSGSIEPLFKELEAEAKQVLDALNMEKVLCSIPT